MRLGLPAELKVYFVPPLYILPVGLCGTMVFELTFLVRPFWLLYRGMSWGIRNLTFSMFQGRDRRVEG